MSVHHDPLINLTMGFAAGYAVSATSWARHMLEMMHEFPDHYDVESGLDYIARETQYLANWIRKTEKYIKTHA